MGHVAHDETLTEAPVGYRCRGLAGGGEGLRVQVDSDKVYW